MHLVYADPAITAVADDGFYAKMFFLGIHENKAVVVWDHFIQYSYKASYVQFKRLEDWLQDLLKTAVELLKYFVWKPHHLITN